MNTERPWSICNWRHHVHYFFAMDPVSVSHICIAKELFWCGLWSDWRRTQKGSNCFTWWEHPQLIIWVAYCTLYIYVYVYMYIYVYIYMYMCATYHGYSTPKYTTIGMLIWTDPASHLVLVPTPSFSGLCQPTFFHKYSWLSKILP